MKPYLHEIKKNLINCSSLDKYYFPNEDVIFALWLALNKNSKNNTKLAVFIVNSSGNEI